MAVRIATSDPKPSSRNLDYDFFYFNKKTSAGGECVALIPRSLRGIVKKGFVFDDAALRYDDKIEASLLELDFDEAPAGDPTLPPREEGWSDPDHLAALESADPQALAAVAERPVIPNRGVRPATARKQNAAARAAEHNIDVDLLMLLDQACAGFNYACRRIGTAEKPRALEAQKILVTCMIPWLKQRGVTLDESDEKGINFA